MIPAKPVRSSPQGVSALAPPSPGFANHLSMNERTAPGKTRSQPCKSSLDAVISDTGCSERSAYGAWQNLTRSPSSGVLSAAGPHPRLCKPDGARAPKDLKPRRHVHVCAAESQIWSVAQPNAALHATHVNLFMFDCRAPDLL